MSKFSHMSHSQGRQIEHDENVTRGIEQAARADRVNNGPIDPRVGGKPKTQKSVPYHDAMSRLQTNAAGIGGQGHGVAAINDGGETIAASSAAAPLASAYGFSDGGGKAGKIVPPSPGMRSRTNEGVETHADKVQHGRDMLAVAVKGGGKS